MPLFHRRFAYLFPLSQKPTRFHVRCSSASRLSSAQGRVPRVRLFTSPAPAPLYSFVSSRSFTLSTLVPSYSAPSAHDVRELGLHAFRSAFPPPALRRSSSPCGAPDPETSSAFRRLASAALTFRPSPPRASFQPRERSPHGAHQQLPFDNPPEPSPFDAGPPLAFTSLQAAAPSRCFGLFRDRPPLQWRNFFRAPWPSGTRILLRSPYGSRA